MMCVGYGGVRGVKIPSAGGEMEQLERRFVIGGESDVQQLHHDEHMHTL